MSIDKEEAARDAGLIGPSVVNDEAEFVPAWPEREVQQPASPSTRRQWRGGGLPVVEGSDGRDQRLVFWPASRRRGGCFCINFPEFVPPIGGQIEVAAAVVAHLNVVGVHQPDNGANGNAHVAAHADLMAHGSHSGFAPGGQAIVVLEDGQRDLSAHLGNRRFHAAAAEVAGLQLLELEQMLKKFFHGTDFI